ncbi:hypothetical protein [uncultured Albimonas sp.]|uniref:hypothetical protein n=1 Tax=uncultured Albimonas sp. TaxID=1331701 RepID=UPI0030ED9C75|tara:strand:- start:3442 stop:4455 length:1014 start_codon:yes stop_codon:yes gene_type:complete
MKVPAARVRAYADRPDSRATGLLIFGDDALEVDQLRLRLSQAVLKAAGEGAEITRMTADEARRYPASLTDALRAGGLFGGQPVVLVEGAADGSAEAMRIACEGLQSDTGRLIVTAGRLNARSKLRKLFEDAPNLAALAVYPRALDAEGIAALLTDVGNPPLSPAAMDALVAFAAIAEAAEVRGVISTLALYAIKAPVPLEAAEVQALLPAAVEGDADAVADATVARRPVEALAAYARVAGKGGGPGGVAMALGRAFRQLHALAAAPDGPEAALARMRPPIFGPRRDALARASRQWKGVALERALEHILDSELSLRATNEIPERALVERLVVRLSTLR